MLFPVNVTDWAHAGFLLQDGAGLYSVSDSFAVVALLVAAVVPHHVNGDAAACDRLRIERTRRSADVHSVYHVPDVLPSVPALIAGGSYPPVFGRKSLQDDALVPLVVYRLSHFLKEIMAVVQGREEVVRILARVYLRLDECLKIRPSGLLSVAAVLLSQSLPRRLSVPRSFFWPLFLERLQGVVCGARYGRKQNTQEILVRLFPCLLRDGIKRRGFSAAQSRWWLGFPFVPLQK